jgi:hypothetical protein
VVIPLANLLQVQRPAPRATYTFDLSALDTTDPDKRM